LYPSYAYVVEYPMDLSTIKARLENRFYRRVTAVQYDVRYVYTNACKFNEPKSDIVRSASIISDLCLEIIRNRDSVDATALYHQLVEKYKIRDEGADENAAGAGPSKSGGSTKRNGSAPNTPNTRSRSRRNSQHTDSESEDTSSKTKSRNGTENGKSKVRIRLLNDDQIPGYNSFCNFRRRESTLVLPKLLLLAGNSNVKT
jgi:hypothetical protein